MKRLIILPCLLLLSACGTGRQFITHDNVLKYQERADIRKTFNERLEIQETEATKQIAIVSNSGYPFTGNTSAPKLPPECTDESAKGEFDDVCDELKKLLGEMQSPPEQPGVVIIANGATFTGNNFFAPGATAGGNVKKTVPKSRPVTIPKVPESDTQTFTRFAFGWLNNLTDKAAQIAPIGILGWFGVEAVKQPNNYVNGDDNTNRNDYVNETVVFEPEIEEVE